MSSCTHATSKAPVHFRSSGIILAAKLTLTSPPRPVSKVTGLTFPETYCRVPKLPRPEVALQREFSYASLLLSAYVTREHHLLDAVLTTCMFSAQQQAAQATVPPPLSGTRKVTAAFPTPPSRHKQLLTFSTSWNWNPVAVGGDVW